MIFLICVVNKVVSFLAFCLYFLSKSIVDKFKLLSVKEKESYWHLFL
jgi:hypothetical protein